MSPDGAELSSIRSTIDDMSRRIARIAERRDADPDDPVSGQLFEVERSLRTALRQLDRVEDRLT